MLALALTAALAAATPAPQGDRLPEGTWCYAITASKDGATQTVGHTFQSIERTTHDGKPALKVVVHQRMGAKFDLRDTFLLDAATLRPFEVASARFGKPHVRDVYDAKGVTETRWDKDGKDTTTTKPLARPVWEGNLYGVMFAALPLEQGASYAVPFYQYDKGEGTFAIDVTGTRTVDTPEGKREAIVLKAGPSKDEQIEYLIGASPRLELAYTGPQGFGQSLAPNCAGFEAAVPATP
ncbi:hypothetical protein LVB87_11265 [Lysobacter sp. KIS68-7]|uniref:DUF3108 domain-containing protein n=1 Tax=Lysobacter sp. KIS68-7 TaxID=2904252 RepID=UPI001E4E4690|nr:hypothetical protein [Lysobacter sp. KIS68-7]UHQ18761.1 hypothetical protein LVB87_11265 [Lysobacter sp. KIS68-7]